MGRSPSRTTWPRTGRRVLDYLRDHPDADVREIREALGLPDTTAKRWFARAQARVQSQA